MEFGLFCNNRRFERTLADGRDRDIFEIATADKLGFEEVWLSEHQTPAELIIAKAAAVTTRIRMGAGVRPLGFYHPLQVALEENATDQLTHGRYMLGAGNGFYAKQMEWRGRDAKDTRAMVEASLELILKLFNAKDPVDYDGPFWQGKQMILQCPPVQAPHPPIAVACTGSEESARLAGRHNLGILTGDFIPVPRLTKIADLAIAEQIKNGHPPSRRKIRSTRVIYVAPTDKQARDDMRESYAKTIAWEIGNTPHHQTERIPQGGTLQDITFDYLVDNGNLFVGSPATVRKRIEEHFDVTGGFGVLLFHAGRDYATPEKLAASMALFMQEVALKVRPLDPDRHARRVIAA
ncbi:MAG: LLM class flavin-dependent oxidoreductase [Betaproteobacteria bacterium]|nr:LLM class flavin-dependent oxidoreductase [Betaproteobacteria bacterium]